jgi:hypothetical protein
MHFDFENKEKYDTNSVLFAPTCGETPVVPGFHRRPGEQRTLDPSDM